MKKFLTLSVMLSIVLMANRGWANNYTPTILTDPPVSGGVNSTTGVITGGAGAGAVSLRSAVIAANAHAGADTITLGTATYTLSISSGGGAENAAASGDLDINDSVAITGNGPANTIITTTYDATCGDGKVFGVNQDGSHSGLTVSFTGLTIQNGFNNGAGFAGSFFETGGGVDFYLTGTGNNYSMTNCVITNCKAIGSTLSHGGGVNVDSANTATVGGASCGTVTFNGCTFTKNSSLREGGGVCLHADKHDVNMINCTVGGPLAADGNQTTDPTTTSAGGGGVIAAHSFGGTVTITGGSIQNNSAIAGGGLVIGFNTIVSVSGVNISDNTSTGAGAGHSSAGGGVAIVELGVAGFTPTITLSGCTINNNHADNNNAAPQGPLGGGIYFSSFYGATVSNCTISGNTAGGGAGVYDGGSGATPAAILTLNSGTTISGNTAAGFGGGIFGADTSGSAIVLNGITISGNTSVSSGGGIQVAGGTLTAKNVTISGNSSSGAGGGMFSGTPTTATPGTTLSNVTISNNRSDANNSGGETGGGIARTGGTVTLQNTLVGGNFRGTGATADDVNGAVNANNSLVENVTGATLTGINNITGQSPRLGPLQNNGGSTLTHQLLGGSPALDAGNNTFASGLTTDQRGTGFARIKDAGDADLTDEVDIGAYEAHPAVEDITDKTTNEDTPLAFVFNFGDTDLTINSITATSGNTTLVPNANLVLTGSGSSRTLTMTPVANLFGNATITVTVSGTENSLPFTSTDTFVLTVNPVADTPSISGTTTPEDIQSSSGLQISRNPVDGAEVTHFKITGITGGTLFKNNGTTQIINNNFITFTEGSAGLKFTPSANQNTPAGNTFTFNVQASLSASDADLGGSTVSPAITVSEVNDAPTANNDTLSNIAEDASQQTILAATLLGNDAKGPANESSQTLTIISAGSAVGGSVSVSSGNVLFTPTANYNGAASFSYTIQDNGTTAGALDPKTSSGTASFTITAVNDQPVANAQSVSLNEDGSILITLTGSDGDPEVTQALTFAITDPPDHGSVSGFNSATGQFTYTPTANYHGPESLQFTVTDDGTAGAPASLTSVAATVSITVNPVADTPSVTGASTKEGQQTTSGLVISRNAVDGAEVTHFKITSVQNGTLFQNNGTTPINGGDFITFAQGNAGLKFTPAAGLYNPGSTFGFSAQASTNGADAGLGGSIVTATISVDPNLDFGDAPAPYPTLLANDGARHVVPFAGATLYLGAAVDIEANGIPQASALGDDTNGLDDEDGVTLPASILAGQSYTVTVVVTGSGGILNAWLDWNKDGDWSDAGEHIITDLSLTAGSHPINLTAPSFGSGGASFARFRLSTQSGLGPTGQAPDGEVEDYAVSLHVNTPPVANPDTVTRAKGRTVKVLKTTLLANDTDADGPSPLSLTSVNSPSANGATVRILDDWVVYEANAGDGNDSFTYSVTDGIATSSGTVSVVVAGAAGVTLNIVSDSNVSGERRFVVAGIPGRSYRLQIATSVLGPWADVSGANATGVATSAGEVLVKDVAPPVGPTVFYRAVEP